MKTPISGDDPKKEAFALFEEGRFAESYALCTTLMSEGKDSSIAVLAATNLLSMGDLDEAEAHFRDLAGKMPESSYVHSYLGMILEKKGDEGAIAEYGTAVALDPANMEALRRYMQFLITSGDDAGAIAPLRQLVALSGKSGDILLLVRALTRTGRAAEAIALHDSRLGERDTGEEYLDALGACGQYRKAADTALVAYHRTNAPFFMRKHLSCLAMVDSGSAREAYAAAWETLDDPGIGYDFCLFLKDREEYAEALDITRDLISRSGDTGVRLLECELLELLGRKEAARDAYEQLIREELGSMDDPDALGRAVSRYREFLMTYYPLKEMVPQFLGLISSHANVICLLATASFYEDLGDTVEARSWYYRAFRSDFLSGGVEYAQFLSRHDDLRECEKCMLYILTNVRKTPDLVRIARVMVEDGRMRYGLKRFLSQLLMKLNERVVNLDSGGLEVLAVAFLLSGTHAIEAHDYRRAKEYCLRGLDVLPPSSRYVLPKDFLALIETCKDRTLSDRPVLPGTGNIHAGAAVPASPSLASMLDLDEREQMIVSFLQVHREASEMDLRKLTGSRRVVGVVNRLMQKASAQGMKMIEKKGIGKDGEVYEYCGP
jgi:tetratricopeptide (TPR) repeat protein